MGQLKVADRYAKSLLQLALEQNKSQEVKSDIELVSKTLEQNKDLALLLKSPIIREDKKNSILTAVFKEALSDLTLSFIKILTKKGRESLLLEICNAYNKLYRKENNIQKVVLITAAPMDKETKDKLLAKISNQGEKLDVEEQIDPELIGGFILKIGDKQVDTSVLGSFRKLRKEFTNNPFVANY
ncbi:MAG: ATP synthase F1 subunit delta [Luteibaculum sp.]